MASNPVPTSELRMIVNKAPAETIVQCNGRITSDSAESLKATIKPLLSESKTVVVDLTNVSYMDSSGPGTIVGLYVSAKAAKSQLRLINLNERLKELFSLTRLGQFFDRRARPGSNPATLIFSARTIHPVQSTGFA